MRIGDVPLNEVVASDKAECPICGVLHDLWMNVRDHFKWNVQTHKVNIALWLHGDWGPRYCVLHFEWDGKQYGPDYELFLAESSVLFT